MAFGGVWKGLNAFRTHAAICQAWHLFHGLHLSRGSQISFCICLCILVCSRQRLTWTSYMGDICLCFPLTGSKQGTVWSANHKTWILPPVEWNKGRALCASLAPLPCPCVACACLAPFLWGSLLGSFCSSALSFHTLYLFTLEKLN